MHVFQRWTELHKVFPNSSLRDQTFLLLEMFDHSREISGVRQLQDNVEFIVFDEGGEILDNIGVIELLK